MSNHVITETTATIRTTCRTGATLRRLADEAGIEDVEVTMTVDPFMGGVAHVVAERDVWEDLYTEALVERAAYDESAHGFQLAGFALDVIDRVRSAFETEEV